MRRLRRALSALFVLVGLAATPGTRGLGLRPARAAEALRRFALIAGNDRGGPGTRPLLYATADARKVWEILTRLGNVRAEDAILLENADAKQFWSTLGQIEARARDAAAHGSKTALVVYFSGHAKDGALRLGDSQLPLDALKARLAAAPVDVRIGIFDSCRSGAMTRTKGARRAPAFEVDTQAQRAARGTVILTSSSADEDSQESDAIGGSYFSHHLASGLLGGADKSGDGRVTLSEAYAYAYERTVADTAESAAGAQHPTFSYDLAGNGDLVLTDVVMRREGLLLPAAAPSGTYYLVDGRGLVAAEVAKQVGAERRVALSPGRYRVKRRLPDHLRIGEVDIPKGQLVALAEDRLIDAPFSDDPVKGAARDQDLSTRFSLGIGVAQQTMFAAPSDGLFPSAGLLNLELGLRNFLRRDWVWSFELSGGNTNHQVNLPTGVTLPYRFNEVSVATSILVEWPNGGDLVPFVGGRLALLLMSRQFDDDTVPPQFFATASPGVVAGARYRVLDSVSLVARGRLHYLLYNVEENSRSLGYWELGGFVQFNFGGDAAGGAP